MKIFNKLSDDDGGDDDDNDDDDDDGRVVIALKLIKVMMTMAIKTIL